MSRVPDDPAHDDRPIAVHLWFPDAPGRGTFLHSLRRTFASILGTPLPGKILTYSFGGAGPVNRFFVNPVLPEEGMIRILRAYDAPRGVWFTETIDIAADFALAFGYHGPLPSHIAVSADMEDTHGRSLAFLADMRFEDD
jgi:hypothetical protein